MRAALAVAAAFLIPAVVILFFAWLATRQGLPCICEDADDCTCGGAWGGRKQ